MSTRSPFSKIPGTKALQNYAVQQPGYEAIQQTLYDTQTYLAAGQTSLTFFQEPQGTNNKTLEETNMETAGSLPNGKKFLVTNIQLLFFPGVLPTTVSNTAVAATAVESEFSNDVYTFGKAGYLDFFIGSKSYLQEAPLAKFPSINSMNIDAAHSISTHQAAAANATAQVNTDYASWGGRVYTLNPPTLLEQVQNFNVKLRWGTAQALPSGQNAKVVCVLGGVLYRRAQ